MSYLQITEGVAPRGWITKLWDVRSVSGDHLGTITWWAHWRKYCFNPKAGQFSVFDPGCLREIADFCETKTSERKNA